MASRAGVVTPGQVACWPLGGHGTTREPRQAAAGIVRREKGPGWTMVWSVAR
jgi:hypothetical protein